MGRRRIVGEEAAPELATEDLRLGRDYPWPGNVRELAQCVSNVLIRHEYRPAARIPAENPRQALAEEILSSRLSAEEVLTRYCTLVYAETGSYRESARRIGLDRRTVKARVDEELLAKLRNAPSHAASKAQRSWGERVRILLDAFANPCGAEPLVM